MAYFNGRKNQKCFHFDTAWYKGIFIECNKLVWDPKPLTKYKKLPHRTPKWIWIQNIQPQEYHYQNLKQINFCPSLSRFELITFSLMHYYCGTLLKIVLQNYLFLLGSMVGFWISNHKNIKRECQKFIWNKTQKSKKAGPF